MVCMYTLYQQHQSNKWLILNDTKCDSIAPSTINKTLAVVSSIVYQKSFFDDMSVDSSAPNNLLFTDAPPNSDAEFDKTENRAIQVALWNLQHPRSCETAKVLVLFQYHHAGIGSTLHIRALQLMMGLDHDRVVVDDPGMFCEHTKENIATQLGSTLISSRCLIVQCP